MGKPLAVIDWKLAADCATAHSPEREIAATVGVALNTLKAAVKRVHKMPLKEWIEKNREHGKSELRRAQFKLAVAGNERMLNWLGRQWLGQKDSIEVEHTGDKPQIFVTLPDNGRSN